MIGGFLDRCVFDRRVVKRLFFSVDGLFQGLFLFYKCVFLRWVLKSVFQFE